MNEDYKRWLENLPDGDALSDELKAIDGNDAEIESRFSSPMRFGTAGLRAVMGAGVARMNVYTVSRTTKALAAIVKRHGGAERGVAIAFDSRNNSRLFAETASRVLAAENVKCFIFDGIRPTPELSFAILQLSCIAGINITASHNPKEYNGYKVYWDDGAQLPPAQADEVSAESDTLDVFGIPKADFDEAVANGLINIIGKEIDEAYINAVLACRVRPSATAKYGDSLNLVYTPLHGTGYALVPETLKRAGITNLRTVSEQMVLDGNFPTVASPNPEYTSCFDLAIKMCGDGCSMMIGTDPDGDRIGVCVRDDGGKYFALSGNQIGALLIDYIIRGRKAEGTLPDNACAIKSIVSGRLFDAVCDAEGVKHIEVLTGFKYIGEKIKEWAESGEQTFIFGYEESHGFLTDGYARDKDGVAASLLVAEMASHYASVGKTLYQALTALYGRYGYFDEKTLEKKITGNDPMGRMKCIMSTLRSSLPSSICGTDVVRVRDYKRGTVTELSTGKETSTGLPESDVLYFELADSTALVVRPSGTEPKVKLYIMVSGSDKADADEKIAKYSEYNIG